ncbi:MAG: glycosyltransferase [Candidatus Pacebacteria bacterium]|nr:glycosyltransferase [Candidatus Paceibacterota bacterium]
MKDSLHKILICSALYLFTAALIGSVFIWVPNQHDQYPILRDFIIFFATVLLTKYFIYMTFGPWNRIVWKMKERVLRHMRHEPRVSVVIPAWNEDVGLIPTIETVLASTYRNLEVIVINDGSTDESDKHMREFIPIYETLRAERASSQPLPELVYRYQQNGGKGSALNHGIALASGDIIISIDADCALTPYTVENFVKYFRDPEVMAAVGNVKIGNTRTLVGTVQYLEFLFSFYFKHVDSLFNTIYIIGGAAGAFRREVFERVGVYSTHNITEDIDLSVRIQKAGMKIVYASDAVVYTEGASTLKGLMQQRLRWKRGRFQTFAEHRSLFFSTEDTHNPFLTWLILPFALFGDTQLFFEVFFVGFLYVYAILAHDFSSFISGIIVVSSMFVVQLFDDAAPKKFGFYLLAPIGWMLFYLTTVVEHRALIRSLWGMVAKQKLSWQRWDRVGVFEQTAHGT